MITRNGVDRAFRAGLDRYGVGHVRSLADYYAYAGLENPKLTLIGSGCNGLNLPAQSLALRELTAERIRAGLGVARQLGRTGGRKRQMTDIKIESAKKLLANRVPQRDGPRTSVCLFQRCIAGFQP